MLLQLFKQKISDSLQGIRCNICLILNECASDFNVILGFHPLAKECKFINDGMWLHKLNLKLTEFTLNILL